jgi:SAM-dependent methyltransferase
MIPTCYKRVRTCYLDGGKSGLQAPFAWELATHWATKFIPSTHRPLFGADSDSNRRLNSDPLLWEFAGDVRGLSVLDAGCGTGYRSKRLRDRGSLVTGVDIAERMVEIARADHPGIDFRLGSASFRHRLTMSRAGQRLLRKPPSLSATHRVRICRTFRSDKIAGRRVVRAPSMSSTL